MTDLDRVVIEQAKGALMLRYGIGSHMAFASLLRWSRDTNTTLHTMANTVVHNISNGSHSELNDPALSQWIEERLRRDSPVDDTPTQPRLRRDPLFAASTIPSQRQPGGDD